MTLFGIISSLPSKEGTGIFIGFLILLVLLESVYSTVLESAEERGLKDLFEKLQKELMMMGIISFVVFIYETANPFGPESPALLSVEMTHIIVLFMALAFLAQGLFLTSYSVTSGKRYTLALRTDSKSLRKQYKNMKLNSSHSWWFHHGSSLLPAFPGFRTDIEFKIIERLFISQHKLSHEFNFAHYVNALFKVRILFELLYLILLWRRTINYSIEVSNK